MALPALFTSGLGAIGRGMGSFGAKTGMWRQGGGSGNTRSPFSGMPTRGGLTRFGQLTVAGAAIEGKKGAENLNKQRGSKR